MAKKSEPVFEEVSTSPEPLFEEVTSSEPVFEESVSSEPMFEEVTSSVPRVEKKQSAEPMFAEVLQSSEPVIEEKKAPRRTTSQRQTSTTSSKAKTDSGKTEQTRTTGNQNNTRRSSSTSTPAHTDSTTSTSTSTRTSSSSSSSQSYTESSSNSSSFWTSFGETLHKSLVILGWICIATTMSITIGCIFLLICQGVGIDVDFIGWGVTIIGMILGVVATIWLKNDFDLYKWWKWVCIIVGASIWCLLFYGLFERCSGSARSSDAESNVTVYVKEGNVATFSCDTKALYFSQEVIDSLGWEEGDKIAYQPCYSDSCLINIDIAKVYEDYKTNMEELTKDESGYCINFGFDITAYSNNQVSIKMKEKIHDNEVHFDRIERKTDKMYNVPDSVVSYTIYVSE